MIGHVTPVGAVEASARGECPCPRCHLPLRLRLSLSSSPTLSFASFYRPLSLSVLIPQLVWWNYVCVCSISGHAIVTSMIFLTVI